MMLVVLRMAPAVAFCLELFSAELHTKYIVKTKMARCVAQIIEVLGTTIYLCTRVFSDDISEWKDAATHICEGKIEAAKIVNELKNQAMQICIKNSMDVPIGQKISILGFFTLIGLYFAWILYLWYRQATENKGISENWEIIEMEV